MTENNDSNSELERKTMKSLRSLADWSQYGVPAVQGSPWKDDGETTLSSLLAVADRGQYGFAKNGVPWESGHKLDIVGWGGVFNRERSRVVISPGPHQTYVQTHRTIDIGENYSFTADRNVAVSISGPPETEENDGLASVAMDAVAAATSGSSETEVTDDSTLLTPLTPLTPLASLASLDTTYAGTEWGKDELVVNGDMTWEFDKKNVMTSGGINRVWLGGVTRFVGIEGIICAGGFARILAGAQATMAAIASGDVYGGCARTSVVRMHLAGFGYRSIEYGGWLMGYYMRHGATTLIPAVGSTSPNMVKSSIASRAAKIVLGVLPFADVLCGLVNLALLPFRLLLALINKVRGKQTKPPDVAPRMLNRTVGTAVAIRNNVVVT